MIISRPWIIDKGSFLEVAPSDSLISSRFPGESFVSSYQWFINGKLVDGQTGPTIQKSLDGNYHVRVVRGGCSSTSLEYSPPHSDLVLGFNSDLESEINIYPNPARNSLNIQGVGDKEGIFKIDVIDLSGKIVKRGIYKGQNDKFPLSIDVSGIKPGFYILKMYSDKYPAVTLRFIKD